MRASCGLNKQRSVALEARATLVGGNIVARQARLIVA